MKVVKSGSLYRIYDDSMETFDNLPKGTYAIKFNDMTGFYLERKEDLEIPEKVYGVQEDKVRKVVRTFGNCQRNLGVILSGDKGIGKSLCMKMIAKSMMDTGYPVILANTYIPGIADYISSITQEVVVLFDEFDKTFSSSSNRGDKDDPQSEMLTLFDGVSVGKKLFIVTCNDIRGLNDYMVNRPGRFHYHFRFDYPTPDEIREYMSDKIDESMYSEIEKVVEFSGRVSLNYDCLRAISFEIMSGESFESAIKDLNIINVDEYRYTVTAVFEDGSKADTLYCMDVFNSDDMRIELTDKNDFDMYVSFNMSNARYDQMTGCMTIDGNDVDLDWEDEYYSDNEDSISKLNARKAKKLKVLTLKRKMPKSIHYCV